MAIAEITSEGLKRKSLQEIRKELRARWVGVFGSAIDLSPSSPDGHHVDLEADGVSELVELAQEVYSSLDPAHAEGVFLDILCDYIGISRIGADYSRVDVVFAGTDGTSIPVGTMVRYPGTSVNFITTATVAVGVSVRCLASAVGAYATPAGALDLISYLPGVTSVAAPYAGVVGRLEETDAELRSRRKTSVHSGMATEEAIKSYIENTVSGVSGVSVTSNRTMVTDSDGRPPKSFEVCAEGGEDSELAAAIWTSQPAGIEPFGYFPPAEAYPFGWPVLDSSGTAQHVRWTRPSSVSAWFQVSITQYEEEALPESWALAVAEAIAEWADGHYTLGKDVIPQRVCVPVFSVPGILNVSVSAAVSYAGTVPTEFTTQRIRVSSRYRVVTDASKITVELG